MKRKTNKPTKPKTEETAVKQPTKRELEIMKAEQNAYEKGFVDGINSAKTNDEYQKPLLERKRLQEQVLRNTGQAIDAIAHVITGMAAALDNTH